MNEKHVLVIDGELSDDRTLADNLRQHGYVTTAAGDGTLGLAIAQAEQFDVVLVDLDIPITDGREVIATLIADQPGLPIVVTSGTGALGDVIAAMRQGAWDYVAKPVQDPDEVTVVIERVLERASLRAEVIRQNHDLQAQSRELAALNRVAYALSDLLDLDSMLHRALDASIAAIEADGGVVRLLNPATDYLVIAVTRGFPASFRDSAQVIPLGLGIVGQVAETGHPRFEHNLSDDPCLAPLTETAGMQSYLCVPLRTGQQIVGTLEMAALSERHFSSREIELVATIGNQIGLALARARYAADLERANAELRRLDTLREQFIQNVAHELRTPLGLAHGYIEMLSQGDLSIKEQQMALGVASRRIKALVALVDSITTLQDLDSQPLRVETVSPVELTRTAMRMAGQRAAANNIIFRESVPPDLPYLSGDFTRLAQALHQLLDNACKFSPDGGTVTVIAEAKPDEVLMSVADEGIGIASQKLEYIFDRFYQADGSARRRYGGTGLGLAIAKEICSAHGGRITVESVKGEGSVFTLHLPRSAGRDA